MRVLIYIMVLSIIFACNSGGYENKSFTTLEPASEEEMTAEADAVMKSSSIDFDGLAEQKIQELAELQLLSNQHPEFKDDVLKQIEELTLDTLNLGLSTEPFNISIDRILAQDSVGNSGDFSRIYLIYIKRPDSIITDTLRVNFLIEETLIDGEMLQSVRTSITSEKQDN